MSTIQNSKSGLGLGEKRLEAKVATSQAKQVKRLKHVLGASYNQGKSQVIDDDLEEVLPVIGGFSTKKMGLVDKEDNIDIEQAFTTGEKTSIDKDVETALADLKAIKAKRVGEVQSQKAKKKSAASEPGVQWRDDPFKAPVFRDASRFFTQELPSSAYAPFVPPPGKCMTKDAPKILTEFTSEEVPPFSVYVNKTSRWRVVAKLAVRSFGLVEEYKKLKASGNSRATTTEDVSSSSDSDSSSGSSSDSDSDSDGDSDNEAMEETKAEVPKIKRTVHDSIDLKNMLRQRSKAERRMLEEGYERPQVGMFKTNSREIAPSIESCPSHVPCINSAISTIMNVITAQRITGYNDVTGAGELRYLSLNACVSPPFIKAYQSKKDDKTQAKKGKAPEKADDSSDDEENVPPRIQKLKEYVGPNDSGKIELTVVWNLQGKSNAEKPKTFDTPKMTKLGDGIVGLAALVKLDKRLAEFLLGLLRAGLNKAAASKVSTSNLPDAHPIWHSVHVNFQNAWSHTNTIFSFDPASWQRIFGPPAIIEVLPIRQNKGAPQLELTYKPPTKSESVESKSEEKVEERTDAKNKKVVLNPKATAEHNAQRLAKCSEPENKHTITPMHLFPPQVFRQANFEGFARIVSRIRPYIPNGSHCVELYGGVGTIGLNLLDKFVSYVCSDENTTNKWCFEETVNLLHPLSRHQKAIKYVPLNATAMVEEGALGESQLTTRDIYNAPEDELKKFQAKGKGQNSITEMKSTAVEEKKSDDPLAALRALKSKAATKDTRLPAPTVCIIDPPRKGLDAAVLDALCAPSKEEEARKRRVKPHKLSTLVYISCGFESFKRDCEQLVKPLNEGGGGWRLAHAEGHALFPGADHMETVAIFVRGGPK